MHYFGLFSTLIFSILLETNRSLAGTQCGVVGVGSADQFGISTSRSESNTRETRSVIEDSEDDGDYEGFYKSLNVSDPYDAYWDSDYTDDEWYEPEYDTLDSNSTSDWQEEETAEPEVNIIRVKDIVKSGTEKNGTVQGTRQKRRAVRRPKSKGLNFVRRFQFNRERVDNVQFQGSNNNRIQGGTNAHPGAICWQVKVLVVLGQQYLLCGGAIIDSTTIITAAHCIMSTGSAGHLSTYPASKFQVQVGALDNQLILNPIPGCGQQYKVSKVIINPSYNPGISNNDIAIIKLAEPIDLANKACACPICLKSSAPDTGTKCLTSGYGTTKYGLTSGIVKLSYVPITIQKNAYDGSCAFGCGLSCKKSKTNLNKFLCASGGVGHDSCQGDSGGPLFCFDSDLKAYYLAGVVSFGLKCGTQIGSQYTKVASYTQFIQKGSGVKAIV